MPSEIESVAVQYFDERKNESFKIEEKNLNEFVIEPQSTTDEKKCLALFNEFRKLNSLAYITEKDLLEKYSNTPPFAIVDVLTKDGKHQTIELSHVPIGIRSKKQFDSFGKPMSFDSENYYGWINNHTDFIMVQDFTLRNILKLRKDFLK